jgi:hypothetical protein
MAMTGVTAGDGTLFSGALIANLVALSVAVADLRQAQQHAAQAAAARAAAAHLHAATSQARSVAPRPRQAEARRPGPSASAADVARGDFPMQLRPGDGPAAGPVPSHPHPYRGPVPPRRAGPGR